MTMKNVYTLLGNFKGWMLCGLLLCLGHLPAWSQQFGIRSFRLLPNDITAYIDPVRDLNNEACALIKVVADKAYAFSTPLGIVQRKNDVGEIWLYVPKGSVQITIKHPKWGVWRDYRFEAPLESRMTYELVIASPVVASNGGLPPIRRKPTNILSTDLHSTDELTPYPSPRPKRPRERLHTLVLANVGVGEYKPSVGLRAGVMRRHGAYLLVQSGLSALPDTDGECNRHGALANSGDTPYYTGHTEQGRFMVLAGGMHRLFSDFCLYEGVGYGKQVVGWETAEGTLLTNTDYSSQGWSAELGGLWRFRRLAVSLGVLTIEAKHWEATVGIGLHF